MRFMAGREMEKGSSPSQKALSSPSSVNHRADSACTQDVIVRVKSSSAILGVYV